MDEAQIAENLKANIPKEEAPKLSQVETIRQDISEGVSTPDNLDDMTAYRITTMLGEEYSPSDGTAKSQAEYIYTKIGDMIGSTDYYEITSKIREVLRIAGLQYTDNKLYKLYQWIKLENMRRNIDVEMENLNG